jgi:streptogramin lyase
VGSVIPADDGLLFAETFASKIGRLNLANNTIDEWTLPLNFYPADMIPGPDGTVFISDENNSIGLLNLSKDSLTLWRVRHFGNLAGSGGNIFFTEFDDDRVAMLNPATNQITEWSIPARGPLTPSGIAVARDGKVFFSEALGNLNAPCLGKFAMLEPSTNTITEWAISNVKSLLMDLQVGGGFAWITDFSPNLLILLDSAHNVIREYQPPTPDSQPNLLVLTPSASSTFFSETAGNNIGELVPAEQKPIATFTATPVVTTVVPVVTDVPRYMIPVTSTRTPVTPTVTPVTGIINRGFTEWMIPTPASFPIGITSVNQNGTIGFGECGSAVGILSR